MTNDKILRYQLKCSKCGYKWDTRYPRIPAKCPSCNGNIYGTYNYEILSTYTKSPCFIATAAYETPLAEEINILRYWRDLFLLKNILGRSFIKIYYTISPSIAIYISQRDVLKSFVRKILNPYIKFLKYNWLYRKII